MKRLILLMAVFWVPLVSVGAGLLGSVPVDAYSSGATTACNQIETGGTPGTIQSCEIGYDGAVAGKLKKVACPDSMGQGSRDPNSLSQAQCFAGFTAGLAAKHPSLPSPPAHPSQANVKACTSAEQGSTTAIQACEIGYAASESGKTKDQVAAICAPLSSGSKTHGTSDECNDGYLLQHGQPLPGAGSKGGGGGSGGGGSGGSTSTKTLTCDEQFNNPLTWIICPVVNALVDIVSAIDSMITDQLNIKTDAIFCTNTQTCQAYYSAWQAFRNIALGLMAIAGLIIVIAQALGAEILDAYTIRKALPRLLVAAVAITLSWPLMKFLIQFSDDLGFGVRSLIYAPFTHLSSSLDLSFGGGISNIFFGGLATAGATVAVPTAIVLTGGIGALLTYAVTAALAVFVAIVVLTLRQILIILMMLLAPIAIVAYILPNTQRVYRLWWDNFIRALLMFPLIAAFIATGRVFAAISINNGGLLNQLIAFIAYFAPYFLIPLTFRLSGGIMSGVGNFVQQRAQGGFEGLRRTRAERGKAKREEVGNKFKTGEFKPIVPSRFKRLNRANRALVNATNNVGTRYNAGLIRGGLGFGARGETAAEQTLMEAAEAAGKEPAVAKNATDNGYNRLQVLMAKHGGDENAAMADLRTWYSSDRNEYNRAFQGKELEDKLSSSQARMRNAGGYTPGRAVASYLNMGRDGTAIRDVRDSGEIAAWVSEGSTTTAYNLLSQVASDSKRGGRTELSPSQENKAALVGATVDAHAGRNVANYDSIVDRATMSGAGGEGAYTVLQNSPSRVVRGNVEHAMDIVRRYNTDPTSVPFNDAAQAASVMMDLQNNVEMGYGKPDNKITFQTAMAEEGRQQLLNSFLAAPVPTGETSTIRAEGPVTSSREAPTTQVPVPVRAYVQQLVGSRGQQLSQEQRQGGAPEPPEPPPEEQP